MSSRSSTAYLAAFCVVIAFVAGIVVGGTTGLTESLGVTGGGSDKTRSQIIESVEDDFYKKVDPDKLEEASYDGIVRSLKDRFSHYFTPEETKQFQKAVNDPQFEGIGVSVAEDKRGLRVVQVYEDSPAKKAGLLKDDLVIEVAGKSIAGEPS